LCDGAVDFDFRKEDGYLLRPDYNAPARSQLIDLRQEPVHHPGFRTVNCQLLLRVEVHEALKQGFWKKGTQAGEAMIFQNQ
jgi:hypothetical protein